MQRLHSNEYPMNSTIALGCVYISGISCFANIAILTFSVKKKAVFNLRHSAPERKREGRFWGASLLVPDASNVEVHQAAYPADLGTPPTSVALADVVAGPDIHDDVHVATHHGLGEAILDPLHHDVVLRADSSAETTPFLGSRFDG